MHNIVYYLTGPDGSGKTSYLEEIKQFLTLHNVEYKHIWIRSPKITTKPLMLFCRIAGLTKYEVIDGVKYGKHEFYRSKFVSWLYPILQYIDFSIKWKLEKSKIKNSDVLLFDRHAIDTLVDVMVDTNKMDLYERPLGKSFLNHIPQKTFIIVMDVDEAIIRKRKLDTLHDENLFQKIKAYKLVSASLNLKVIDNNRPYEEVRNDILNCLNF